ncbi:thioredoxin family protein [Pedobacter sp. MC2016-14]|uniref:thioredoxin family protein n=1 Tax=Pedobacter sp. MC2016-14 TaxID=2897327 RepID=UPI001E50E671|nr:thioredoxin family protein [Pedobacter sp. MC2016-14]MCD0487159.1 thioredoxin family protein [Pedobacter sp. MC2016-14]
MKRLVLVAFAFMMLSTAAIAQEAVHIYNPKADAQADINAAAAKAKKANKNVFVQVGGNWCVWCIRFHNLVEKTPELKTYLNDKFETVLVNMSKENKNAVLLNKLGNPGRFGYPVFLILDGDGKVLHIENSAYLEENDGHSVKKIQGFLHNWTYEAVHEKVK